MRQTAKQLLAGGRHGGAAGLYCTGADRTRWVWEVILAGKTSIL